MTKPNTKNIQQLKRTTLKTNTHNINTHKTHTEQHDNQTDT